PSFLFPEVPMQKTLRKLGLVVGCLACAVTWIGMAAAQDFKLEGNWKLVLSPSADTEFLIIKTATKDGQPAAEMLNFNPGLGPFEVRKIEQQGDSVTLQFGRQG